MINRSGIYKITCTVNGRFYIGSAVNFRYRWACHTSQAKKGKHHSRYLQNAWNKYGESAFGFEVLLLCAKEDLIMYEQRTIDALKPRFNMSPTAGSSLGSKQTMITRKRISDRKKGKPVGLSTEQEAYRVARVKEVHRALWSNPEWREKRLKKARESGVLRRGKTPNYREGWIEEVTKRMTGANNSNFGKKWSDSRKAELSAVKRTDSKVERVLVGDQMMTFMDMSERCGISRVTIRDRIHKGWTPEKAMSEPASIYKKSDAHKAALSKAKTGVPNPKRDTDKCLKAVCVGNTQFRSRTEAAAFFGVSNGTITNWVDRGSVAEGNGVYSNLPAKAQTWATT